MDARARPGRPHSAHRGGRPGDGPIPVRRGEAPGRTQPREAGRVDAGARRAALALLRRGSRQPDGQVRDGGSGAAAVLDVARLAIRAGPQYPPVMATSITHAQARALHATVGTHLDYF